MVNYKKLKSDKLQELLQSANAEESAQICAVLKDRGIEPKLPEAKPAKAESKAAKTDEELLAEAKAVAKEQDPEFEKKIEAAKANVGHRCKVVPFNTVDWVDGTIIGITIDPAASRIAYAIKTDDGKRMLKSVTTKLIKISEETVDLDSVIKRRPKGASSAGRTEEDLQKAIAEALPNVGKQLVIDEETTARIDGLLIDRRTMRVMYKYKQNGGQKFKSLNPDIELADYASDEDREFGTKYAENFKAGAKLTKAERIAKVKASIERYEAQLAKWKEELAKLEAEPDDEEKAE